MNYQPLDCRLYDLIEIFCMRQYELAVETVDGEQIHAKALTTRTSPDHEEYLQLDCADGLREVRLDRIAAITVLNEGSGFTRTEFGTNTCAI